MKSLFEQMGGTYRKVEIISFPTSHFLTKKISLLAYGDSDTYDI